MAAERKGFVGTVFGKDYREVTTSGHALLLERAFVVPPGAGAARWKARLRRPLKWLARGLYLGPLFIVVALVASVFSPTASDLTTVAFVCVLVTFFALLSPYLALSAVEFRVGETGRARLRVPFSRSGSPTLARPPARDLSADSRRSPPSEGRVRIRGRVVELEPRPAGLGPILVDGWFRNSEPPSRVTEAVDFAIVDDEGQVAVVECLAAPTLIAPPSTHPSAEMLNAMSEATRRAFAEHGPVSGIESGDWVTLRAGDEVEVVGAVERALPNVRGFELSGRTCSVPGGSTVGPYRGAAARTGLLLRCNGNDAATVQKLRAAR